MTTGPRFETLFEEPGLPRFELPHELEDAYGQFGLAEDVVFANFVAAVDGVADIPEVSVSSPIISGGHPADRFLLGLLRACADVVVVGAGTFRAHPGPWTAEQGYAPAAAAFADLRARLGAPDRPKQVVVSSSGKIDGSSEKLRDTLVVTTAAGVTTLKDVEAEGFDVVEVGGSGEVDVGRMMSILSERGFRRILAEGGPRLMGRLLEAGVVDELFLTVSPLVAGGGRDRPRPGLAAGVDLLPGTRLGTRLLSARRSESYLFLRYALEPPTRVDR
ncbi:MAG: dihydrofolate reductase family protein [Actinomycetota bacterium]